MRFSSCAVNFSRAEFSGGTIYFSDAAFSSGIVQFSGAKFCGGTVLFYGAEFSSAEVDFRRAGDWSHPPKFDWEGLPPAGVKLPAAGSSVSQ